MAHGAPDWSRYRSDSTSYSLQDLAEHAVRLGSIVSFDRRGDVVHLCSFEDGLGIYALTAIGPGAAAVLSAERTRTGAYSVKLTTPAGVVGPATFVAYFPYPRRSMMGFEVSFTAGQYLDHIDFEFWLYTPTGRERPGLRFSLPTNTLAYRDAAGAWVTLMTGLGYAWADVLFHTVKLVVDWPAGEYERVIFDDRQQNMAGVAYQVDGVVVQPMIRIQAEVLPVAAQTTACYFDDVIVTHNEP